MTALGLGLSLGLASTAAQEAEKSIALKEPLFKPLPPAPAPAPPGPKAAFKETEFPLSAAVNHLEVLAAVGPLSQAEAVFLEKNRFLLRPRPAFDRDSALAYDEMLGHFDHLGGPLEEQLRRPEHARFIGPDVFIHALSRFLAARQAAAETGPMLESLHQMTEGLYQNASALRTGRTGQSAANWERLMAQLLVPLVILGQAEDEEADLPAALARLAARGQGLPSSLTARVQTELRRVHLAQEKAANLLGLTPAGGEPELDYAIFRPPGYFAADRAARAYFRAATWFQELGWDPRAEAGLADALNFALALSFEPPAQKGWVPRAALTRLLELSSFFYGPAREPGWAEWTPFLMKEAGVPEFTANTAADSEVLIRLQAAALETSLFPKRRREATALIQVLPRRLSWPSLLAENLTSLWPDSTSPPFSALWLPVLWRQSLAEETIGRQLDFSAPEPLGPRAAVGPSAGSASFLEKVAQQLKNRPDDYWFSSLGAAWWPVWTTLTGRYGQGYPLYMRSWAFAAKELETIFGGLAYLSTPLAGTAARGLPGPPAARREAPADQPPAPLVKGFVEPNPPFWRQMNRLVKFLMSGFQHFDLFPEDLEEAGALNRLLRRLERSADLAEKELAGEALSEDDYEFIRLFSLDWMAAPPGGPGLRPAAENESFTVSEMWSAGGQSVFEATAEPWLILVLVGNENSPRLTVGLVYNHYEFLSSLTRARAVELWRQSVSGRDPAIPPPPKNFWYESLWP